MVELPLSGESATENPGLGCSATCNHALVAKAAPDMAEIAAFLSDFHAEQATDLEPLSGGFWSSAYGYRVGDQSLVARFGTMPEGFEMDRAAMAFGGPDLPIPRVVEVGEALGMSFAISERHEGRFLEDVAPNEVDRSGPALMRLLRGLRGAEADPGASSAWYSDQPHANTTWRKWLGDGLIDDPARRVSGWRATLAADPKLDALYRESERTIADLLEACPERRDLVHGDLLHRNVLVAEDASEVTAIFSWKCSVRGDFLFDVAWCTFWAGWYPGIEAIDVWGRSIESAPADDLVDAAVRHHCYELQIGTSHLGWNVWTGNAEELERTAARTAEVLERGPRTP